MNTIWPRTSQEAKLKLQEAIEGDNFELAKELHGYVIKLENYEREAALSQTVVNYFDQKDKLTGRHVANSKIYADEIEQSIFNTREFYKNEFNEMVNRQNEELQHLINTTKNEISEYEIQMEQMQDCTLQTARLLASQCKFDEAVELRDSAKKNVKLEVIKYEKQAVNSMKRKASEMIRRHRSEMERMKAQMMQEIEILEAMLEASSQGSLEVFLTHNALLLEKIAVRFPSGSHIPHSLKLQTVKPSIDISKVSSEASDLDPDFVKSMKRTGQIFQTLTFRPKVA